jgi:hypothetical protein
MNKSPLNRNTIRKIFFRKIPGEELLWFPVQAPASMSPAMDHEGEVSSTRGRGTGAPPALTKIHLSAKISMFFSSM